MTRDCPNIKELVVKLIGVGVRVEGLGQLLIN